MDPLTHGKGNPAMGGNIATRGGLTDLPPPLHPTPLTEQSLYDPSPNSRVMFTLIAAGRLQSQDSAV